MASDRDDRRAAATALASLQRLADLGPALVLPAHGPLPAHPDAALQAAFRRAKRLVDDPDGAVWYGARRVFAYAQHTPVDQRTLNIPCPKGWT